MPAADQCSCHHVFLLPFPAAARQRGEPDGGVMCAAVFNFGLDVICKSTGALAKLHLVSA
jgi:hypothetical protein